MSATRIERRGVTLDSALDIANDVKRIYEMMGTQASYPYHPWQITRAMLTILDNAKLDGVDASEVTLWKRRYTGLRARYAKFAKGHGVEINEAAVADVDSSAGSDDLSA